MSTDLATMVLRLEAEISQYQTKLAQATKQLQQFQQDTNNSLDEIKGYFEKAFDAALIYEYAKSVEEFAASTIESIASLDKLSQSAGVSVEALSSLRLAAAASGITQDDLAVSFKKLNQAISEAAGDPTSKAAAAFKSLGVSIVNADGSLRSVEQVLPLISQAFQSAADGPNKVAIAIDLLGRSGANMIPFLNGGTKALDEFKQKAEEAGLVISGQTAKAAEEFTTKVSVLRAALIGGFGVQVESQLLPVLDRLADDLTGAGNATELLKDGATVLVTGFKLITEQLLIVGGALKLVYDVVSTLFKVFSDFTKFDFSALGKDLADGFTNAGRTISNTAGAVTDLWDEGGKSADAYKKKAEAAASISIRPDNGSAGAFDAFSNIDLSKIGQGLGHGFVEADKVTAATFGDLNTAWKAADVAMTAYYSSAIKNSKTPIIDPAVLADQQKSLAELTGPDLSHVGAGLGAGFTAAQGPVEATWKAATDSADAYGAQVKAISKTPLTDPATVNDQVQSISGLSAAWKASSIIVNALWKTASSAADAYFGDVEDGSKTPLIDPRVVADQQKALEGLHGADLDGVGKSLAEGFDAAKGPIDATWKAAQAGADDYLARVETISKTPIVDAQAIAEQEKSLQVLRGVDLGSVGESLSAGFARADAALSTTSAAVGDLWKTADDSAGAYFADVLAGSKTPIIDASATAGITALTDVDLGRAGQSLADGFAKATPAVEAASADVADLWKTAEDSAADYFARLEAGNKTPIVDASVIADQGKIFESLQGVHLGAIGEELGAGFTRADAAVATTTAAVSGLWKTADASADAYFSSVEVRSKTPIIDPDVIAGPAKVLAALADVDLGGIGVELGAGFDKADAHIATTSGAVDDLWLAADKSAGAYFASIEAGSKTPLVDPSVVADQQKLLVGLTGGLDLRQLGEGLSDGLLDARGSIASTSGAIDALWKNADAAAAGYYDILAKSNATPLTDPAIAADQRNLLATLSGADFSKVGAGLGEGFARADASIATAATAVEDLWKTADASASDYFDDVAAGSKLPIVDPRAASEQARAFEGLSGVDLSRVGETLSQGFGQADAAIATAGGAIDTLWKSADSSADVYFERVSVGSKTPIVDPGTAADGRALLAGLSGVDLSSVGAGLSAGFADAGAAVATTTAAVGNLWKTADSSADAYFLRVAAGSATPLIDPKVVADQEKLLEGLHGSDLSKIGESLGDGFASAKAPITSTWSVAQDSADVYFEQVQTIAKTPIIDADTVKDQASSIALLGVAWRTASITAHALWLGAKAAASDYFGGVEEQSKTPIVDPGVLAAQQKAFADLKSNTHLGDVGKDLTDGLSASGRALIEVSGEVDNLWKSAGDSAEGFFDKLHTASGAALPQLVPDTQIVAQAQAQKKLEEFAGAIQAQSQSFGLGGAAATAFRLNVGALGDALTLAKKNLNETAFSADAGAKALHALAQATLDQAEAAKQASAALQGQQDVKTLKDYVASINQQIIALDQGTVAANNFKLSTGAIGEAVERATKTLAQVPAGSNAANDSVRALAQSLLTLVGNAKTASVALQAKQDTTEIDNYTAKLNEQLLKFQQSDVAAVDFASTAGKLGRALRSGSDEAVAATAHIHDLAVELTLAKDKDALFNVDQEILTMTGHLSEAAKAAFEFQNKLLIKNVAATSDPGTQKQIDDLKKLGVSQGQYNDAVEKAAQLQTDEALAEATIRQQQTKDGQLTLAGQQQINAARLIEHAQLDQLKIVAAAYGQQQLDTLAKLKESLAQYDDLQRESTQIRSAESLTQSAINLQIAKGQSTTIEGQKQIAEAYGAEAAQLQVIYDKLYALGQSSGLIEIQDQAKALRIEINDLQTKAIDPLATKLKTDFVEDASDAWTSFVTGAKTAHQALTDFLTSFESEIIKLISKNLLEKLLGGSDSSGGIFSLLAGFLGGTGGASTSLTYTPDLGGAITELGVGLAGGGKAKAGVSYVIGEHGAERFTPDTDGTVTPNSQMWGKGGDTIINLNVSAPNGSVNRQTREQLAASTIQGLNRSGRRSN